VGFITTTSGFRFSVQTGDRDAFQLASNHTTILYPVRAGELARIGPAEVREKYGVDPKQVPAFIVLRGDRSEKVPGAPRCGRDGSRIERYGGLEAALKAGRFPATMDRKAPIPILRSQKPTWEKAAALVRKWGLNQLADRL